MVLASGTKSTVHPRSIRRLTDFTGTTVTAATFTNDHPTTNPVVPGGTTTNATTAATTTVPQIGDQTSLAALVPAALLAVGTGVVGVFLMRSCSRCRLRGRGPSSMKAPASFVVSEHMRRTRGGLTSYLSCITT